jgi:hypothetical protein
MAARWTAPAGRPAPGSAALRAAETETRQVIAHIVLYRPRPDVSPEGTRALGEAVRRTCRDAPSVRRLSVGRLVDVGAGYLGGFGETTFEYAAIIEFEDRAGLLQYLAHPAHAELSALFWKSCESTAILDSEEFDAV